jgi:hypothetical protein
MEAKIPVSDKRLEQALEQVRGSHEEAVRFTADPAAYLQAKGVSTDGLRFNAAKVELSDTDLEHVAGGMKPTVCSSVGCVVCITIGDDGTLA